MARDNNVLRAILVGLNDYLAIYKGLLSEVSNFYSGIVVSCENIKRRGHKLL